jgi:hypothetical protein
MPVFLWNHGARHANKLICAGPKAPEWTTPDSKWDGTPLYIAVHRVFGCRVYTHINRPLGTLDARGEEMRYLGFSHDPNFHHIMYRARDRRVFTTDDVSFVETDIQLPDYILELELAGLLSVTAEDGLLIDAHAERDDEVDGEQLSLDRFDDQYTQASVSTRSGW